MAVGAAILTKPFKGFSMDRSFTDTKDSKIVTILHTSDLHLSDCSSDDGFEINLQTIKKTLNAIRKDSPNTVLLHNGNFQESKPTSEQSYGERFKALESIGYDAVVLGQKDLCQCDDFFNTLANTDSISVIDSYGIKNIQHLKPLKYKIIKKGNYRIGIISNPAANNSAIKTNESTSILLSRIAERLKNFHHCALVVCLSTGNTHLPNTTPLKHDIELASMTSCIDVIISGNNEVTQPINYVCQNSEKQEVVIHASSFSGSSVGRLDIALCNKMQKRNIKVYYKDLI